MSNDLDYLLNEIVDYKDLLNQQLPADNQWAAPLIQNVFHDMKGVTLEELKKVEEIFNLHIDVFALRELTGNDKNRGGTNKTPATVVRLSDRPSDRSVSLLLKIDENGV